MRLEIDSPGLSIVSWLFEFCLIWYFFVFTWRHFPCCLVSYNFFAAYDLLYCPFAWNKNIASKDGKKDDDNDDKLTIFQQRPCNFAHFYLSHTKNVTTTVRVLYMHTFPIITKLKCLPCSWQSSVFTLTI